MGEHHEQLRRGTAVGGERLPTIEQCALQREEYERDQWADLQDGPRHISGLVDLVMARVRFRVAMRKGRHGKIEGDDRRRRAG